MLEPMAFDTVGLDRRLGLSEVELTVGDAMG